MDQLFKEFLDEAEKCMKLYMEAPQNIKQAVLDKRSPTLPDSIQDFMRFYEDHNESYLKLKVLMKQEILNLNAIDKNLAVFRETSRWFDYAHCRWSENYDAIEECHKKIAIPLYYIDEKYKLGHHMRGR